ncbi:MAG: galactokinase family protein [Planctomycetota bacterium]
MKPAANDTAANDTAAEETLVRRVRTELAALFTPDKPLRIARAPGRLDVMGGIADYTGSLVCEMPIEQSAAVASQERGDRQVCVVGLNLLDEHKPFQFQMPLDKLAATDIPTLRAQLHEPLPGDHGTNRTWAGYVVGCLKVLAEEGLLDLAALPGLNLALYSTVPSGAGVSSSAAVEVATMMNLVGRFGIDIDGPRVAVLCQRVENDVVGAPCGLMDQMASVMGERGKLMRMVCQPHELLEPLTLPDGVRVVGINSNVKHSVGGGAYGKTRTAAFMAHTLIVDAIKQMAERAGKRMIADPTGGYLANVDPDDYKRHFRPLLPEQAEGGAFLDAHGDTADPITSPATTPQRGTFYHVQAACDHHVLEARRVKQFAAFLGSGHLDKAGHLMYASHHSYTTKAQLGADECDVLVDLVRVNEPAGLHGAKITGGGSGGTVAILCNNDTDDAIKQIMADYEQRTGLTPQPIAGSSHGAWATGSWDVA